MYFLRTDLAQSVLFRYNVNKFARKDVLSMKPLEESRAALDAVDRQIVRLFEERMEIARDVARYKLANHLPVLDRSREEQVLASRVAMLGNECWAESVRKLFEGIMALSRSEQERLLKSAGEGDA